MGHWSGCFFDPPHMRLAAAMITEYIVVRVTQNLML